MSADSEHRNKAWYLVQCRPRQDERAEHHLRRQGYTCFRSTCQREQPHREQRRLISESLFPGYLFIQLSALDNWGPLRSTRGVSRVVGFGDKPLPIRQAVIEELQTRDGQPLVNPRLHAGETVRIQHGPLAHLEAVFMAMQGQERVLLLMNLLQREQRISLPLRDVSR